MKYSPAINSASKVLPKIFRSEHYAARKEAITKTIEEEKKNLLAQLNSIASIPSVQIWRYDTVSRG